MSNDLHSSDPLDIMDDIERAEWKEDTKDLLKDEAPAQIPKHDKSFVRRVASSLPLLKRRQRFRNRSLIRLIGSSLPLKPCRRPYFEILAETNRKFLSNARQLIDENVQTVKSHVATLADIGRLWDEIATERFDENTLPTTYCSEEDSFFNLEDAESIERDLSLSHISSISDGKSDSKILALEEELARLREQIAMIVTLNSTDTSYPDSNICAKAAPPPPPPPPPPTPAKLTKIKPKHSTPLEAKMNKAEDKENEEQGNKGQKRHVPSMNEILQGLGNVKLRSVKLDRSPGGTPLRPRKPLNNLNSTDPADIIANALRKKFAKSRRSFGSPVNKEAPLSPVAGFTPTPPPTPENERVTKSSRRRSALFCDTKTLATVQEGSI